MLDKKFLQSDTGKKQIIAYVLHVHHHIYQKDIAKYYGCANNTIGYWVKNLKPYEHLKDFQHLMQAQHVEIEKILSSMQQNPR